MSLSREDIIRIGREAQEEELRERKRSNGAEIHPPPDFETRFPPVDVPRVPRRILTGIEFIRGHVPPVWLIQGIVQRSKFYACTSNTGHGKTAVWLFNACMIQVGRMIGSLRTFAGNTLILAGENPDDLQARMLGMKGKYGLDELPYVLPGSFPMSEIEAAALKRDIAGLGVPFVLIIGDTAASFFPGEDENSNVQSGQYARTLRSFTNCPGNPAIMALCHPIKNASRDLLLPRGGGAFLAELDVNLRLWMEDREATELWWQGKIRGPDFNPFSYRMREMETGLDDEHGEPEKTVIAEPMSEEETANHSKQLRANEDAVLQALRDYPEWSWNQIARHAGWTDAAGNAERWRVQRALNNLAADKLVEQLRKGDRWQITNKGLDYLNLQPEREKRSKAPKNGN